MLDDIHDVGERLKKLQEKYHALCHAMQSGVAMKMNYDEGETTPKHLRVGINAAMSDHSALVQLLVAKGLITMEEYFELLVKQMRNEVSMYERWLSQKLGAKIDLA